MNQEDIIKLAREAGFHSHHNPDLYDCMVASDKAIERFAALVEDDLKRRLADAIEQMPFGDTATSFAVYVRNFK